MRWLNTKDLRSTVGALFSVSTAPRASLAEHAAQLDEIRRRMLALALLANSERSEMLLRKIRYAVSAEALWFARGELMAQLARVHGEGAAREKLETLTGMFTGVLPRGLRSRPSPLDGTYRSTLPAEEG